MIRASDRTLEADYLPPAHGAITCGGCLEVRVRVKFPSNKNLPAFWQGCSVFFGTGGCGGTGKKEKRKIRTTKPPKSLACCCWSGLWVGLVICAGSRKIPKCLKELKLLWGVGIELVNGGL